MNILYLIIPIAMLMALGFVGAFFWAAGKGQYDDLETPALKMLADEYLKEGRNEKKR